MAISLYSYTDITSTPQSIDGGSGIRVMVFIGSTNSGSDSITNVTWNGESFTKKGSIQSGTARYSTIWTLKPSGTGTANIAITGGFASSGLLIYQNAQNPKNFNSKNGTSGTSDSLSITANDGDWLIGGAISNVGNISVSTNTTLRSSTGSIIQADSNGVSNPTALAYTFSSGAYALTGIALESIPLLTASQGSYSLSGNSSILKRIYGFILAKGAYIVTGISNTITLTKKFVLPSKNTSSWTNNSQNTSTINLQNKNTSSWNNQSQN